MAASGRTALIVFVLAAAACTVAFAPRSPQYDWRFTASRQFGAFDLHAALSGGGPGDDYYDQRSHARTALVVGAGWSF